MCSESKPIALPRHGCCRERRDRVPAKQPLADPRAHRRLVEASDKLGQAVGERDDDHIAGQDVHAGDEWRCEMERGGVEKVEPVAWQRSAVPFRAIARRVPYTRCSGDWLAGARLHRSSDPEQPLFFLSNHMFEGLDCRLVLNHQEEFAVVLNVGAQVCSFVPFCAF
jgi:hypothetical protein